MKRLLLLSIIFFSLNANSQGVFGNKITPRFILNASYGVSYRVAKSPSGLSPELNSYIKDLKSGNSYDATIYYVSYKKNNGYGIKYNVHQSKANTGLYNITAPNGDVGVGNISDNITITFIGPSFCFNDYNNNKTGEFNMEIALGYMSYKDVTNLLGNYTIKGATLGAVTTLGYNFKISEGLYFGPQVNFIGGVVSDMTIDGPNGYHISKKLPDDQKENLWRIDISAGLRFRF